MRKYRRLAVAAALLIMIAAVAVPAGAQASRGFILIGADAAYAEYQHDFTNGGTDYVLQVSVGYVDADLLIFFDGEIIRPHTDVAVSLCVYEADDFCTGPTTQLLEGVKSLPFEGTAEIVTLRSASLGEFQITIDDGGGVSVDLILDLDWLATGRSRREVIREPGIFAVHRTRDANVTGTITFDSITGPSPLSALVTLDVADLDTFPDNPLRITRFFEINAGTG